MLNAFFWGLFATSSLVLGGIIAIRFNLGKRFIGIIMGFGAGALISAVSYELVYEAVRLSKGTGFTAYGILTGAFVFYIADWLIDRAGGNETMSMDAPKHSRLIVPMILAIILDGIPESIVIGLGIFEGGSVSLAMLVAVFISNLPESIASSAGMKAEGRSKQRILLIWLLISVFCAGATVAGYRFFGHASVQWLSFVQAFAGGAILMMLANSMIPEAFEHGGKKAGIATVLGFFVSVTMVVLETI